MPLNNSYDEQAVVQAIASALETFYGTLIEKIDGLNIQKVMKRKNPYLYRAKAMQSATEIVDSVLTAFVSSSEETIFGNCFFEPIAIAASGGNKALAEGIDIMIQNNETNTISAIAVKSGPSVFNADSKKRQEQNFTAASKLAQQAKARYEAYIGYCYGKKKESGRGKPKMYQELAGKRFWAELTGDEDFYIKIIEYMGTMPEKYVADYKESYNRAANRLVPFKLSLEDFLRQLNEIRLTLDESQNNIETDGGPGSGRYPKGSGKKNEKSGSKKKKSQSLPMTAKEKAKVMHDINNVYHAKYKGKRVCAIRTSSNEPDSPTYYYRFKNHGFDDYDIFMKTEED